MQSYSEITLHTLFQQGHLQLFQIVMDNIKPTYVVAQTIEIAISAINRQTSNKGYLQRIQYSNLNNIFNYLITNAINSNVNLVTLQQGFIFT